MSGSATYHAALDLRARRRQGDERVPTLRSKPPHTPIHKGIHKGGRPPKAPAPLCGGGRRPPPLWGLFFYVFGLLGLAWPPRRPQADCKARPTQPSQGKESQAAKPNQAIIKTFPCWVQTFKCWVQTYKCWVQTYKCWVQTYKCWVQTLTTSSL